MRCRIWLLTCLRTATKPILPPSPMRPWLRPKALRWKMALRPPPLWPSLVTVVFWENPFLAQSPRWARLRSHLMGSLLWTSVQLHSQTPPPPNRLKNPPPKMTHLRPQRIRWRLSRRCPRHPPLWTRTAPSPIWMRMPIQTPRTAVQLPDLPAAAGSHRRPKAQRLQNLHLQKNHLTNPQRHRPASLPPLLSQQHL